MITQVAYTTHTYNSEINSDCVQVPFSINGLKYNIADEWQRKSISFEVASSHNNPYIMASM